MSSTDPEVIKMVGKFVNAIYSLSQSAFHFYVHILSVYLFQDLHTCIHFCQDVYQ